MLLFPLLLPLLPTHVLQLPSHLTPLNEVLAASVAAGSVAQARAVLWPRGRV